MERFDRRDRRFLLACLAVIAIGAALTGALFRRAFPEASIEFRVNRSEARVRGEKLLNDLGRKISGTHFAGRFEVEEEPKVYLERELGRVGPGESIAGDLGLVEHEVDRAGDPQAGLRVAVEQLA